MSNIEIKDRVPTLPNRFKLIKEDGAYEYVKLERADEPIEAGTPLNKELFENFYNNILTTTKEAVVDYVVEEDTPQIEIENLDLIADGGFYELVIMGYTGTNTGIGLRINGVAAGYYSRQYSSSSGASRNFMDIGCGSGGITVAWFGIINNELRVTTIGSYSSAYPHFVNFTRSGISNINTMSFILPDGSSANSIIKAGTRIKISKRR